TPMRILYNQADAAPVWYSEAYYQKLIDHPTELVEIPAGQNVSETYVVGQLKAAPHAQAAKDFMDFLTGPTAKAIYRKYGFTTN
ncbi:MAG: substrate-binding domain-containing protein, partial [Mucilaginibacter sp.]|nr:substrate-binding domain-containing protein [Mucilaginibacter sp.]